MAPDITSRENQDIGPRRTYTHCPTRGNLKKESVRLKTYRNWPVSFLDSKKLAKNGFYYTNTRDYAKCAFCDVQIGYWEEGDDPEQEHLKHQPECPFIRGQDCGNSTEEDGGEDEDGEEATPSQDVCGSHGLEIRPFSGPERPGKVPFSIESSNLWRNFEQLGVSRISGPVSPAYATYHSRLKTFESWKIPEIQAPENLAEAGFYYIMSDDQVLCFHCGGGLQHWEKDDDPWVEHARWFSRCGFVITRKGKEFVNEVLAKDVQMASEALRELPINDEKKYEAKQPEKKGTETIPSTPSTLTPPASTSTSDKESHASESSSSEGRELELCRICYMRERGIVFLPCGHLVSCPECAPSLSTCPVCRKPFEAIVRAYLS